MTRREALVVVACGMAASSCRGNEYNFALPASGQPPQVAVQSTTGAVVVSWTSVEEPVAYVIFLSPDPSAMPEPSTSCRGGGPVVSPCVLDSLHGEAPPLQAGQVQYVRVVALVDDLVDGFNPENEAHRAQLDRLPLLAARPAYAEEAAGPSVWAGLSHITGDDGVYLYGAWFTDAVPTTHTCRVFWGDTPDGGPGNEEPCASEDFLVSDYLDALSHAYDKPGTYYPLLDVGTDDGRFGQASTTVTRL